MSTVLRRYSGPGVLALVGLGFDLGTFTGSSIAAYSVWGVALLWATYASLPWLRRLRFRSPFTLASADPERIESWTDTPPTKITDARFEDQSVPLDGFAYDRCTFVRCTFVYKGEKPFTLTNFKVLENWNVEAASPSLHHFSRLLSALKLVRKDVEVAEELGPTEPVAYGELRRAGGLFQEAESTENAKSPEEVRALQDQRRKRISEWRFAILDFNFDGSGGFSGTDTYAQMKPHLQSEVVETFEKQRMFVVGNGARGDWYKYALLDEVARIEREWGLL